MARDHQLKMDAREVSKYVSEVFPQSDQYGFEVDELSGGNIKVSMELRDEHARPGGTVSGPTMFALADCAAYLLVLSHVGKIALAVTTNLNINFLSKPPSQGRLVAHGTILKLGKRLVISEVSMFSDSDDTLVAHATATYSVPPQK